MGNNQLIQIAKLNHNKAGLVEICRKILTPGLELLDESSPEIYLFREYVKLLKYDEALKEHEDVFEKIKTLSGLESELNAPSEFLGNALKASDQTCVN